MCVTEVFTYCPRKTEDISAGAQVFTYCPGKTEDIGASALTPFGRHAGHGSWFLTNEQQVINLRQTGAKWLGKDLPQYLHT